MKDNYQRRNRVAALVLEHCSATIGAVVQARAQANPNATQVAIEHRVVLSSYAMVLAALAGETRAEKLGIDPFSPLAMRLANLISDPIKEPSPND